MRFHAITTFNADGLNLYGRRMVSSFCQFWPRDIPLTVYAEGWHETLQRARIVDLPLSAPWLADFKHRHKGKPTNNYRMDAVRFSHKIAAVLHAAKMVDADVLIWIDGDVTTHSPVMRMDLEELAPERFQWLSWLARDAMYPECGFYMMNLKHLRHADAMSDLEAMYVKDKLFDLPEWHDSFVLEQVVKRCDIGVKSISGAGAKTMHPMINGPLGKWFDHAKGNRKKAGRSSARDLVKPRQEAYWQ